MGGGKIFPSKGWERGRYALVWKGSEKVIPCQGMGERKVCPSMEGKREKKFPDKV